MCTRTAEMQSPSEKNENVPPHPKGWEEKVRNVLQHSCSLLVNQRMDWFWTGWVWSTTHPRSVSCFSVCVWVFTLQLVSNSTLEGVWTSTTHTSAPREGPAIDRYPAELSPFHFLFCTLSHSLPVYFLVSLSSELNIQLLPFWHCKQKLQREDMTLFGAFSP